MSGTSITHPLNSKETARSFTAAVMMLSSWMFFLCAVPAQEEGTQIPQDQMHRTGHVQIEIPGYNPDVVNDVSSIASIRGSKRKFRNLIEPITRHGKKYAQIGGQTVSYEVDVPESYTPNKPHGVLVYVSANSEGRIPKSFRKVLGDYNLIGIGANDSGNKTNSLYRHFKAIQAVLVIKNRYSVNPNRYYISGLSGGARVCSKVMIMNALTFDGGFPMCGANPMLPMKYTAKKGGKTIQHSGEWRNPVKERLKKAALKNRYVFYTGSDDFNKPNMVTVSRGYKKHGFKYIKYLEAPNADHSVASEKYVRKAIEFLDNPTKQKGKKK